MLVHVPFDMGSLAKEKKRSEVLSSITEHPNASRFKRVLCVVSTHANKNTLVSFTKDGATDFDKVKRNIGPLVFCP